MSEADALVLGCEGQNVSLAGELCGMPKRDASRRAHELLRSWGWMMPGTASWKNTRQA